MCSNLKPGSYRIWRKRVRYSLVIVANMLVSTAIAVPAERDTRQVARAQESAIQSPVVASITIGDQRWMRDNLAVTRFRNGDPVPMISSAAAWATDGRMRRPAWSTYANASSVPPNWGLLYNYYAVSDPRGLCPIGWRLPSNADWRQLEKALGGGRAAAFALKSATGWPAGGAGENSSGFGALPAGFRSQRGEFFLGRRVAYFWSLDQASNRTTTAHMLFDDSSPLFRIQYEPAMGMSLRCIAQ
jgi:uncharacterized protein (TIGR02145 family)